jgi:hypothetical protein
MSFHASATRRFAVENALRINMIEKTDSMANYRQFTDASISTNGDYQSPPGSV